MGKNQIPFRLPERFERYRHIISVPWGSTVEDQMNKPVIIDCDLQALSKDRFREVIEDLVNAHKVAAQMTLLFRLEEDGVLKK